MKNRLLYISLCFALFSCSANKFLPEGEKYFEGHEIKFTDNASALPRNVKFNLSDELKPDGTRKFFVSRPGTWIYQVIKEPKKTKSLSHWIKYKLGKKPVYLSSVNLDHNVSIIESKLNSNGFFRADVTAGIDSTKHNAIAVYQVDLGTPYYFDTLEVCTEPTAICTKIDSLHKADPQIVAGDLFQKFKLEDERQQISKYFKNDGYFYFTPGFTYFSADSSSDGHLVKLRLQVKEQIPEVGLSQYMVNSATLNLAAGSKNTKIIGDSLRIEIDPDKLFIKPKKLAPFIAIKPGKLYSAHDEETTLKQLNRLEVFDFVNIQYVPDTSNGNHFLAARLLANPKPKHSVRSEINLSTTSTGFTGPGLQLEYYNRNVFHGAEKFRFTATGRYEKQLGQHQQGLTSYDIELKAALLFPRVGLPFITEKVNKGNVPKTKYEVGYRLYDQPDYYAQSSVGTSFGYEWLRGNALFNDLKLINFDYVKLLRSSDRLEELFQQGILSRESFDDLFIFGPSYGFTYSPPIDNDKIFRFYLGGSAESSGSILNGFYALANAPQNENGQYTLGNVPFAQYVRFQLDFRTYYKLSKFNKLAFRQNIGLGIPFRNSSELPFSKQFFVGGASSLRGFHARSVGPGTYNNTSGTRNSYFDQTGDILIELNIEDRIDLGGFLEGAVFVDAGNVWLKNSSDARPGGKFKWKDFGSEMAISSGVGLRLNLQFVIIRFDFGVPLRKPYQEGNNGWVFKDIKLNNKWLNDNLILNIAIGYPF